MQPNSTPDHIVSGDDVILKPFNISGFTGDTKAAFLNEDISRAPFIALLRMEPGAVLRKHYHPSTTEAVYVVEGELINDGKPLGAGSCTSHGPNVVHGPHETRKGCTLMFIQTVPVGPDDSVFAD